MNTRIAFLFPGQGSQFVGMGRELFETGPAAVRTLYQEASDLLGIDLARLCFEGPEEQLRQTVYTQPALLVHSVATAHWLAQEGIRPHFSAGHSLGEYSALVDAGAIRFADALQVVRVRAQSMQAAGETQPGGMAAVLGLDADQVRVCCERTASHHGVVQPANYNAPDQTVISGEIEAVRAAGAACKEAGARRIVELNVHGAFHSPLMQSAVEPLREALRQVEITSARLPVISNVSGRSAVSGPEIRELLGLQVVRPVRWFESMRELDRMGATLYVECGPGTVLKGLLKRTVNQARVVSVGAPDDLPEVRAVLEADAGGVET